MSMIDPAWRDLTATQRDFLIVCAHEGPSSTRTLARGVGISESQAGRVRDALAEKGLLDVDAVDGRELSISLTDDGAALVEAHGA